MTLQKDANFYMYSAIFQLQGGALSFLFYDFSSISNEVMRL